MNRSAVHPDPTATGLDHPEQSLGDAALARTCPADNTDLLARTDLEADPFQDKW